jgi:high-affinity Fe2+/Pb2+ permease
MNNICKDNHEFRVFRVLRMVVFGLGFAVLFAFIFGYVVQHLWNWLMVDLFGFKLITYWQGFGLVILAKILFGGFGRHHERHHKYWHKAKYYKGRCGSGDEWKYFDEYWNEEGKTAFENYIKRVKKSD